MATMAKDQRHTVACVGSEGVFSGAGNFLPPGPRPSAPPLSDIVADLCAGRTPGGSPSSGPRPSAPPASDVFADVGDENGPPGAGDDENEERTPPIALEKDGVPLPPFGVLGAGNIGGDFPRWKRLQKRMFSGMGLVVVALVGAVVGLARRGRPTRLEAAPLVDFLYTFGAPSVANPHTSNPGNKCIPGIRTYTEDISSGDDCEESEAGWKCEEHFTSTDFAACFNSNVYPHPKMSTLTLRWRDQAHVEYIWSECRDTEGVDQYKHQWWPGSHQPVGDDIHRLDWHYERRLARVPAEVRGPLLEYASVSACHRHGADEVQDCLDTYSGGWDMNLPGVGPLGWRVLGFMNLKAKLKEGPDNDTVFVLNRDDDEGRRECIISFKGSEVHGGDLSDFLFQKDGAGDYCGRSGVHAGVKDELWQITKSPQYRRNIKPALASCQEVSCVGHSLGGALCNVFTMCANQEIENLGAKDDRDNYCSLVWNKADLCV